MSRAVKSSSASKLQWWLQATIPTTPQLLHTRANKHICHRHVLLSAIQDSMAAVDAELTIDLEPELAKLGATSELEDALAAESEARLATAAVDSRMTSAAGAVP